MTHKFELRKPFLPIPKPRLSDPLETEKVELRDHSEITSVFSDFHRARPGGITTGQLLGHTEDPLPALPFHSRSEWKGRAGRIGGAVVR